MISQQLRKRGIKDKRVLRAMGSIPREQFIPQDQQPYAYEDTPLPIGNGQTISQPYIVARMLELLKVNRDEKVLDIGTGSGYQAAVLSTLARHVYTLEIIQKLSQRATQTLTALGITNVTVIHTNAREGYPKHAPYDAIISAATSENIPQAWKDQLTTDGRIVAPLKQLSGQRIVRVTKHGSVFHTEEFELVTFVPLV